MTVLLSSRLLTAGLLFLFIFPSGYLLTRIGKPYNPLIITVHKLAGVALGVLLVMWSYRVYQAGEMEAIDTVGLIITALCFITLVASGSLLSAQQDFPKVIKALHKVFPYVTVLATVILVAAVL